MQALNIIFLGDQSGKGTFFPEGILGKINTPKGFDELASGTENFPIWPKKAPQVFTSLSPCRSVFSIVALFLGLCLWQTCIKHCGLTHDFVLSKVHSHHFQMGGNISTLRMVEVLWTDPFSIAVWTQNNGFVYCR